MRRALAALTALAVLSGGALALAQSDVFAPQATAARLPPPGSPVSSPAGQPARAIDATPMNMDLTPRRTATRVPSTARVESRASLALAPGDCAVFVQSPYNL